MCKFLVSHHVWCMQNALRRPTVDRSGCINIIRQCNGPDLPRIPQCFETMVSMEAVPKAVLIAFGIDPGLPLKTLSGGSLDCYLVGSEVVLRPSEDDEESEQIAQIMNELDQVKSKDAQYRISRPIPLAADPLRYVHGGWTAWSFVSGHGRNGNESWDETLRTSRAFHNDLGKINMSKPEFLDRRMDGFRQADLVAWGEKHLEDFTVTTNQAVTSRITEPLRQLEELKRSFNSEIPSQLVHGDIYGNMLFEDDGQPPGIIDLTFFWRPAKTGDAIAVADGLMWRGEGDDLVKLYGTDHDSIQVLVRALMFRTVRWAIKAQVRDTGSDAAWVDKMLPLVNFEGPVNIVRKYVD